MAASDGLSDAEWAIWEPFFPPERGRVGQPAKVPTRTFLNALLWMTGEGALAGATGAVRALEHGLAALRALAGSGRVRGSLRSYGRTRGVARARPDARLDGDPRSSACGRSKAKQGGQQSAAVALGRSRGGFSTKLHIRADAHGLPLAFALTGGERHDLAAVPELLDGVRLARTLVIADPGYDADGLRSHLLLRGALPVIPASRTGASRWRMMKLLIERATASSGLSLS